MAALARSVLVTGSNRGIGLELVRQLAASPRPPQHIFATCRDPKGPRGKALQELAAQHSSIKLVQLDTVNLPSIQGAMQAVGYHLKDQGLNLLINNAGISSHATLHSLDSQEMLDVFATNAVGPLQVVKVYLDLSGFSCLGRCSPVGIRNFCHSWSQGREGLSCSRAAVINISSKLGSLGLCLRVPEAPMYPYRASKAAQNMVTRCLAAELQDKGILCVAIHPGWVKTDMGTEQALLTVEHSVRGILTVLASLSQDNSGAFLDWEGNSLPW
ncbi:PREDICTED: C-factor-like [Sturnus vulgaris]|uniref:C-factor-like n=1 Tax=Sturnus vulgaris TaxID=9172 RepID=UPI00071A9350|nr:PREDICTED: C-factor-like [Sturnus vulgaris]